MFRKLFFLASFLSSVNGRYAKYQRFMDYHGTNLRAKRFQSFHAGDNNEEIPPVDHKNKFNEILHSCDVIDPNMDMFLCRKAKMLGKFVDENPVPDYHRKWKVCDELIHKLNQPDLTTRNRLDSYCLNYMQLLYNKTKRTQYLQTRGYAGKSKVYYHHFGNN